MKRNNTSIQIVQPPRALFLFSTLLRITTNIIHHNRIILLTISQTKTNTTPQPHQPQMQTSPSNLEIGPNRACLFCAPLLRFSFAWKQGGGIKKRILFCCYRWAYVLLSIVRLGLKGGNMCVVMVWVLRCFVCFGKKKGKSATYKEGSILSTFFIGLLDNFE